MNKYGALVCALTLAVGAGWAVSGRAQDIGDAVKQGAKQATENVAVGETQKGVEAAADKLQHGLGKFFSRRKNKKSEDQAQASAGNAGGNTNAAAQSQGGASQPPGSASAAAGAGKAQAGDLRAYSKFDFVPGDKVVAFEDFSQDAIGDFPDVWNTNSTGDVVSLNDASGHWLALKKQGRYVPEFVKALPDNFTLEFDLQSNPNISDYSSNLKIWMLSGGQTNKEFSGWFLTDEHRSGVAVALQPTNVYNHSGRGRIYTYADGAVVINGDENEVRYLKGANKNSVKVSIWRQKQRVRVYVDQEKVFDLPRAFAAGKNYDFLMFELPSDMKNEDAYYVSNVKLAVGAPDTRNKLIKEGKFSTTGILFAVNSAQIRPESYGVLKDIADVLKDNASVRVTIVGHTDSDGDPDYNMKLSAKRAEAVKAALSGEFGIDGARMTTDGKGASQPVADNNTAAGKAQNRRVEFVKR